MSSVLDSVRAEVNEAVRPLLGMIRGVLARGIVALVDDDAAIQVLQLRVRRGEVASQIEHPQPLGLSCVPLAGAEAVIASIAGATDHQVALLVEDRRYRPTGAPGNTVLYSLHGTGSNQVRLTLRADGIRAYGGFLQANGYINAVGGFRAKGMAGITGTFAVANDGIPGQVASITVTGGIVTAIGVV